MMSAVQAEQQHGFKLALRLITTLQRTFATNAKDKLCGDGNGNYGNHAP